MPRVVALILLFVSTPVIALADGEQFALQSDLDHVWTMTAAALVFFMQAGFLFVEAGSVRSKNSINVAHKNMMDFALSSLCFGLIGFALMFGNSYGGFIGFSADYAFFRFEGDWTLTFFVFQMMFCGTAATIVSGAVAERASMLGYFCITLVIATAVYPVIGHWAWGGLLAPTDLPWLAALGFMDFAGSTVVHSVGGWVALAAVIIIGPRFGRFDANGKPHKMHADSGHLWGAYPVGRLDRFQWRIDDDGQWGFCQDHREHHDRGGCWGGDADHDRSVPQWASPARMVDKRVSFGIGCHHCGVRCCVCPIRISDRCGWGDCLFLLCAVVGQLAD
jgi:hypothetical protein